MMYYFKKLSNKIGLLVLSLFLMQACTTKQSYPTIGSPAPLYTVNDILMPSQPGRLIFEKLGYLIDYSNAEFGYISILAPEQLKKQKAQVIIEEKIYTYDLFPEGYIILPLQEGDGVYTIRILENIVSTQYSVVATIQIQVEMVDEFSAFLYPNQIVDYTPETLVVLESLLLGERVLSEIERVYEVYYFVINLLSYDYEKADLARTTYILPDLDESFLNQSGICFDYASMMSAMLRVLHIPTRVITGFTDLGYHAWVEVYVKDEGWINPSLFFKQNEWTHVDPTFDDTGTYRGAYQANGRY
jgi:hypothetical protein